MRVFLIYLLVLSLLGCTTPRVTNVSVSYYTIIDNVVTQKSSFDTIHYNRFEEEYKKMTEEIKIIPFNTWGEYFTYVRERNRRKRDFGEYTHADMLVFYYFHQMGAYAKVKGYGPYIMKTIPLQHEERILSK